MSVTVFFAQVSKRRNSTFQGIFTTSFDCVLKDATSIDRPTFLLSAASFDYNAAQWGGRYYFVTDVISVRNNQWEVSCMLDVLATYKSEILASTQYVTYSASSPGNSQWLPDTRIPVLNDTEVDKNTESLSALFSLTGFYVLTVVGQTGTETFAFDRSTLNTLISNVQNWRNTSISNIINAIPAAPTGSTTEAGAIDALSGFLKSLQTATVNSDFLGNAYANAPACIRSCIWVPFLSSAFTTGTPKNVYLGEFDTGISASGVRTTPVTGYKGIDIPWFHTDWRRAYCESVYLYLPLVGLIQLSADSITNTNGIVVHYSATASDGCVCYEVEAGGEIIGTYAGQASSNYAIGINQQASAGEIVQSLMAGAEKMTNAAIRSSVSPISIAGATAGVALQGVNAAYSTMDVAKSTHPSCIGGIGGGAGVGLDLSIQCYTVNHETIVNPSDMAATMGYPCMTPMTLSGLTGFTQCANAHVPAPAQAEELDAIDHYLNSGFYIE